MKMGIQPGDQDCSNLHQHLGWPKDGKEAQWLVWLDNVFNPSSTYYKGFMNLQKLGLAVDLPHRWSKPIPVHI